MLEDDSYTYAYDSKGNRISRTAKSGGAVETYSYDSQNRLVGYSSPTTSATYAYDALDRRIAKTVDGTVTVFVYDPWGLDSTASDVLLDFDAGALTKRWLHGPHVDEPLGFEAYSGTTADGTGTAHEVFADRLGAVIEVVEAATGTVVSRQRFDSFGLRTATGPLLQRYGFTGREHDAESGLIHYRARAYDPATGMFLQRDPIGFAAGDLNLYAYTWTDPYNWTDPSGLAVSTDFAMLSAGLVGLGTACYTTGACQNAGKAVGGIGGLFGVLSNIIGQWNDYFSNILESKNDRKRPKDTSAIEQKLAEALAELEALKSKPNKTKEDNKRLAQLERRVKHLRLKLKKSEPHGIDSTRR